MSFPYVLSNLAVQMPVVLEESIVTGEVPRQLVQPCTPPPGARSSKGAY